jgi:hypothetical protein
MAAKDFDNQGHLPYKGKPHRCSQKNTMEFCKVRDLLNKIAISGLKAAAVLIVALSLVANLSSCSQETNERLDALEKNSARMADRMDNYDVLLEKLVEQFGLLVSVAEGFQKLAEELKVSVFELIEEFQAKAEEATEPTLEDFESNFDEIVIPGQEPQTSSEGEVEGESAEDDNTCEESLNEKKVDEGNEELKWWEKLYNWGTGNSEGKRAEKKVDREECPGDNPSPEPPAARGEAFKPLAGCPEGYVCLGNGSGQCSPKGFDEVEAIISDFDNYAKEDDKIDNKILTARKIDMILSASQNLDNVGEGIGQQSLVHVVLRPLSLGREYRESYPRFFLHCIKHPQASEVRRAAVVSCRTIVDNTRNFGLDVFESDLVITEGACEDGGVHARFRIRVLPNDQDIDAIKRSIVDRYTYVAKPFLSLFDYNSFYREYFLSLFDVLLMQ